MADVTDINVLDIGHASVCTGLLRAMGARVTSFGHSAADSAASQNARRNRLLTKLLQSADVLIDGLATDECDEALIAAVDLAAVNPNLIHCTIGRLGLRRTDAVFSVVAQFAELYAYQQILVVLLQGADSRRGCHLNMSLYGGLSSAGSGGLPISWLTSVLNAGFSAPPRNPEMRMMRAQDGILIVPVMALESCPQRRSSRPIAIGQEMGWDRADGARFHRVFVADAVRELEAAGILCGGISHSISAPVEPSISVGGIGQRLSSHAAARWAGAVVRAIDSPVDPKTIAVWGREIAAAPGTIKNWCRTAGVPPRASLAFARVLRAILWRQRTGRRPEDLLDVVDRRTLESLLRLGTPELRAAVLPNTVAQYFLRQRWISDQAALNEVTMELRARGIDINCHVSTDQQVSDDLRGPTEPTRVGSMNAIR